MNSRIENTSSGRFLYIETCSDENDFETKMAEAISNTGILTPNSVFAYGSLCLEYNISGFISLDEFLLNASLKEEDIGSIMIQLAAAADTVRNYLLDEGSLLLASDRIFIDKDKKQIKICVLPNYCGDFEASLKELIIKLIMNTDQEDNNAVKLGFRLLKSTADPDFRLHDVLEAMSDRKSVKPESLKGNVKPETSILKAAEFSGENTISPDKCTDKEEVIRERNKRFHSDFSGDICERNLTADGSDSADNETYKQDAFTDRTYGYSYEQEADKEESEEENSSRVRLKDSLSGMLISEAILIAAAVVIFLVKGKSMLIRLLPIYLIIAACVCVYYVVSYILKRKAEA